MICPLSIVHVMTLRGYNIPPPLPCHGGQIDTSITTTSLFLEGGVAICKMRTRRAFVPCPSYGEHSYGDTKMEKHQYKLYHGGEGSTKKYEKPRGKLPGKRLHNHFFTQYESRYILLLGQILDPSSKKWGKGGAHPTKKWWL